jgi:membrane protease YdiL (CAAX protease family)
MDHITQFSIHASYGLALLLFLAAAAWRLSVVRGREPGAPPELPVGRVHVWVYRPWDLVGIALLVGIFYALAAGGAEIDGPIKITASGLIASIGLQFMQAGIALAIVIQRVNPVQWLGLRWKEWPWVILIAPAAVVCMWMFSLGLMGLGYMDFLDKLGIAKVQDTVAIFQEEKSVVVLILMAVAAAIVAPVCEEVIFRGYLYPATKCFVGPWVSALSTALVFSAAHGSVAALLPLFVFGLILVALYEWTGSIWPSVAAHFLFNAATVAVQLAIRFYDLPVPI